MNSVAVFPPVRRGRRPHGCDALGGHRPAGQACSAGGLVLVVVASEIKALAEDVHDQAEEIETLIGQIERQTTETVETTRVLAGDLADQMDLLTDINEASAKLNRDADKLGVELDEIATSGTPGTRPAQPAATDD